MKKTNIEKIYDLSPMQEGMLYHKLLDENDDSYFVQIRTSIERALDLDLIKKTLELLSYKHELLRTAYVYRSISVPKQVLLKKRDIEQSYYDLHEEKNIEEKIKEIEEEDRKRNFDLEKDSLLRVIIIKKADSEYDIVWSNHHIIMDGWCLSILFGDFVNIYLRLENGEEIESIIKSIDKEMKNVDSYSTYINHIKKENLEEGLNYYKKLLAGVDSCCEIPAMRRNIKAETSVEEYYLTLDEEDKKRISDKCTELRITQSTFMETAWSILLQKYTRLDCVSFGKVVSGRNLEIKGIENKIGLFVNTIPVCATKSDKTTIKDMLTDMKKQDVESEGYFLNSLGDIQNETELKRDLIKHLFVFENYYVSNNTIDGLSGFNFRITDSHEQTNYDLILRIAVFDEIKCNFEYNPQKYTADEVDVIASVYKNIIMEMLNDVDAIVNNINPTSDEEKNRVLVEFDAEGNDKYLDDTIVTCFDDIVKKSADKTALIFGEKKYTYKELDEISSRVAYTLQKKGLSQGDKVAMVLDRSEYVVFLQLAVLKAGCIFVPIDSLYPDERLNYIINDSEATIAIVEDNRNLDGLDISAHVIKKSELLADENMDYEKVVISPENPCYVIYTSGSTGKPKGCLLTQKGIVNFCKNNNTLETLEKLDHVTGVSVNTVAFDFFIAESLFLLLNGYEVVIANEEEQINQEKIAELIKKNNVNVIQTTPTRFKMYIEDDKEINHINNLEMITLSGEELTKELFVKICELTDAKIYNPCGPSEACVWAAGGDIEECTKNKDYPIHIGKPVCNTHLYVVDNNLNILPVGMPGELAIGGIGVGLGYINRDELTKEKYVDNPYANGKLYKTGDLAKWNFEGNIEYLGRIDNQIKIHGLRVELSEIENVIKKLSSLSKVAVLCKPNKDSEKEICCYYISENDLDVDALRNELRKELPEYMLPVKYMRMDSFPTTATGKLDAKNFPLIDGVVIKKYDAPVNETQKFICEVYAEVLGIERVGINDNFFEIGGHSLRATKVINRINKELNTNITLKDIFSNSTPKALADIYECTDDENVTEIIPKAEKKEYYSMSSAQRRLFTVSELDENSLAYNMPSCYKVDGDLSCEKLHEALCELVKRHEALRTGFETKNGEPVQIIYDDAEIDFKEYSIDESINECFRKFVKPFKLSKPSLFRIHIVTDRYNQKYFMFDMHHIISDGMSMGLFIRELSYEYNGLELDSVDVQYKDYSEWIINDHKSVIESNKKHWLDVYSTKPAKLDLHTDKKRPRRQMFEGDQIFETIDGKLYKDIKGYCKNNGITEYMFIYGTLALLLHKYTHQNDIVIGTPVSGRTNSSLENVMGMFVNTLALRCEINKEDRVADFFNKVKEQCIADFDNQEYPFDELLEELQIPREPSRNPLFDVMLVLQNNESIIPKFDGFELSYCKDIQYPVSKFDFLVDITEIRDTFMVRWEYSKALFDRETIEDMYKRYVCLINGIINDSNKAITDLEIALEKDTKRIESFNDTYAVRDYETICEMFENVVLNNKNKIAIETKNETLSYEELDKRASALAGFLLKNDIKNEDIVPFMLTRNSNMIVTILGILKAGGAYLPIDPEYPQGRIDYMIEDSKSRFLICDSVTVSKNSGNAKLINIDELEINDNEKYYKDNKNKVSVDGNSLCYCIYTSGTTGKPKGTLVEHRTLANLVNWEINKTSIKLDGRVLAGTTISFDVATQEILSTLGAGGTLILLEDGVKTNFNEYLERIIDKNADVIFCTPSYLDLLFMQTGKVHEICNQLSDIVLAGEAIFINEKYETEIKNVRIHNHYGPTETHVVTYKTYENGFEFGDGSIGKPVDNTQIHILDEANNIVPVGVPGELCIAGECVGRGYLYNDNLTAKKFINNPFGDGKMYKTGDLAIWRNDGEIEFIGRVDDQVKIRGLRIELDEIKKCILSISGIDEAAVIVSNGTGGDKYIVAYYVSDSVSETDIRNDLRTKLADYMVPSYIVKVDYMPVNANGKLDKEKLAAIPIEKKETYVEPRNKYEEVICSCVEKVLGIEKVSAEANFFNIGGHSLKAMMLANAIEKELGIRLSLKNIFDNADLDLLAKFVEGKEVGSHDSIGKHEEKNCYPMSAAQKRMYILQQMQKDSIAYNVPCFMKVANELDIERLQIALDEVVENNTILRTVLKQENGDMIQEVLSDVSYKIAIIKNQKEKDEFIKPFDLEKGPLFRIGYFKEENLLMLDMHHSISDEMTIINMMNMLFKLYDGEKVTKPELQYYDYSEWMRCEHKDVIEEQKKYWFEKYNGNTAQIDVFTDYERPKTKSYKGDKKSIVIDETFAEEIKKYTEKMNITKYTLFLSALMITISKYSREEEIRVGTPVSGRVNSDIEEMLGMFVNTLALKTRIEAKATCRDVINNVNKECLESFDNQEFPFDELIKELNIETEANRNPLFDYMFTYVNVNKNGNIPVYEVEELNNYNVEKFDSTITVNDADDKLEIIWNYSEDLFEKKTVEGMLDTMVNIARNIIKDDARLVSELEVVDESTASRIKKECVSVSDYGENYTIVELFKEQVKVNKDKTAVKYNGMTMSYEELDLLSDKLASKICKNISADTHYVAIDIDKSINMIVGLIAILKSNCAYVPLDLSYPDNQISYILKDCSIDTVITNSDKDILSDYNIISYDCLETNVDKFEERKEDLSDAYVIYTSGTTGKPKGTVIRQKAVIRLVKNTNYIDFSDVVILQTGSLAFDASTFEIWGALLNGGTLCMADKEVLLSPDSLKNEIVKNNVNAMFLTTTLFNQMVELNVSVFDSVEWLLFGGEMASNYHVKLFKKHNLKTNLLNVYGPTECTTFATYFDTKNWNAKKRIPIGKTIANTGAYIMLNDKICNYGMPGEICLSGPGVASGYINNEKLTREKFVVSKELDGEMIYKTGDLGRLLDNGVIECLGRIDEQVKIRGFRIEISGIEYIIRYLDYIKDCAVIVGKNERGEKEIWAYYTSGNTIDNNALIKDIEAYLPSYMIPHKIMQLDKIPTNRNGKLDTGKLPVIKGEIKKDIIKPRNDIEDMLCKAYCDVIGIEEVSVDDDFFRIGGHSILVAKLVGEIEERSSKRLSLKDVFEYRTPEKLAVVIEKSSSSERMNKAEEKKTYAMTSAQKRISFIQDMDENDTIYNMPICFELDKDIDFARLKSAFEKVISMNEMLRTKLVCIDGEYVQEVCNEIDADCTYIETDGDINTVIRDFIRPFDLKNANVIRIQLVKNNGKMYFMFDMHHAAGDGTSVGILLDEIGRIYNGEDVSKKYFQYKDYSEYINNRDFADAEKYWVEQFEEEVTAIDLPYDNVRNKYQTSNGGFYEISLPKNVLDDVKRFCDENRITEHMYLMSMLYITLSKHSAQSDIVIGSILDGRTSYETQDMIGMFVNTLPVRIITDEKFTVNALLDEVKRKCENAIEYQEYPLDKLIEKVCKDRDVSRNPLFDVTFSMKNSSKVDFSIGKANATALKIKDHKAKFDMSIDAWSMTDGYKFGVEYNSDLFNEKTIEYIMKHYVQMVEDGIYSADKLLNDINLLLDEEQDICAPETTWTESGVDNIVEMFINQRKNTPDNIAVIFENESVTYEELDRMSNSVAYNLLKSGVKKQDYVCLMTQRSIEMVVGIIAIMKIGAVYVPVDPTYPKDRIEYIISDVGASAILYYFKDMNNSIYANGVDAIKASSLNGINISEVMDDEEEVVIDVNGEDLIYAIYTSGTSGTPKGAMLRHNSFANLIRWYAKQFSIEEKDRICLVTSVCFDACQKNIFTPLCYGGAVVVYDIDDLNYNTLTKCVYENKVTMIDCPKSIFLPLVFENEENDYMKISSLEKVEMGGEQFNCVDLRKWIKSDNCHSKIYNAYGPTECTDICTIYECSEEDIMNKNTVPIGKSIDNVFIYILDGDKPCGIGMPGELCIAGINVGNGYINRPELNSQKFIKNPFGRGLMYRTGDLARRDVNGNICFMGRIDDQIKIRGNRVELSEIEKNIKQIDGVKKCVVVVKTDSQGENALFAYYTSGKKLDNRVVLELLSEKMPDYMVPSYIMEIDNIPLTSNGKIDMKSLPEIVEKMTNYVEPVTETEKKICDIFAEVLKVEKIGVEDNFFNLGGHSLRAVKVINLIELEFGIRIPLKMIFNLKTPKMIADFIGENEIKNTNVCIEKADEDKDCFIMSPQQKRMFSICYMDTDNTTYNMPSLIEVGEEVDELRYEEALKQIMDKHDILRTSFAMKDGQFVQIVDKEAEADFAVIDADDSFEWSELIKPFNIQKAPLIRMRVIRKNNHKYLYIDMHHIISDGASMNIIVNDLIAAYEGKKLEKAELQYKDYSEWIANNREIYDKQAEYWKNKLVDLTSLDLPTDFTRPSVMSSKGAYYKRYVDGYVTKTKRFCDAHNITPYMFWLGNLNMLLAFYSGKDDIVVGNTVSGRTNAQLDNMVGLFVNTPVMRSSIDWSEKYIEYIKRVNEECIEVQDNQDYQFDEIIDLINAPRDISRNPIFDVMMVYQNNENLISEKDADKVNGVDISKEFTAAKYDITFNIFEENNNLVVSAEYCTDLYKEETIANMIECFISISEKVMDDDSLNLSKYVSATDKDIKKITEVFNSKLVWDNEKHDVMDLFDSIVEQHGNEIAVECDGKSLTYYELQKRTYEIANCILEYATSENNVVAIKVDRSVDMMACMFGAMRSGCAYVVIDKNYPETRVRYILENSKACLMITDEEEQIDYGVENVVYSEIKKNSEFNEVIDRTNRLIYIIFTSGTTGEPKGVGITHANLVSLVESCEMYMGGVDTLVSSTVPTFDAFVYEWAMSILCGRKFVLTKDLYDSEGFAADVKNNKNVCMLCPPTKFLMYYDSVDKSFIKNISTIFIGGEIFNPDLYKKLKEVNPDINIYNSYGPTETTVVCTNKLIEDEHDINIGVPTKNSNIFIVNSENNNVPIGVYGEILITGHGVGRYINDEKLNSTKYIDNPFGKGKAYKSGDVGRWNEKGEIEYLGRMDRQVKIRGLRIEIGEIENALCAIEAITSAYVFVNPNDKNILLAYYASEENIDNNSIVEALSERLPQYMIPSGFMKVEKMPYNNNGKLDIAKLPEFIFEDDEEYVEPSGKKEKVLNDVVKEVLELDKVSMKADFFSIGGDSIKAVRVVTALKKDGWTLSVKDVLSSKYLCSIAEKMEETVDKTENTKTIEKLDDKYNKFEAIVKERICNGFDAYNDNLQLGNVEYVFKPNIQQKVFIDNDNISMQSVAIRDVDNGESIKYVLTNIVMTNSLFTSKYDSEKDEITMYNTDECDITMVDLSDLELSDEIVLQIIEKIRMDLITSRKMEMLSETIIVKNKSVYVVLLKIHHCMWDAMSMDIYENRIRTMLNDDTKKIENDFNYGEYINKVEENSIRYRKKKLKDNEYLGRWIDSSTEVGNIIGKNEKCQMMFSVELLDEQKDRSIEDSMQFSSDLYKLLLEDKINTDEYDIPVLLINHGRNDSENMDEMGMFLDFIPMLTEKDEKGMDEELLKETIREKEIYNISYISMLADQIKVSNGIGIINYKGIFDASKFEESKKQYFKEIDIVKDCKNEGYEYALEIDYIDNHAVFTVVCDKDCSDNVKERIKDYIQNY